MTLTTLYRYKSFADWDKNRFLSEIDDIKNNRITLVSPELFNDPYDCLIPFFENISEEEKHDTDMDYDFARKYLEANTTS